MLYAVAFLGLLTSGALAASKFEANSYIDTVLRNYLPKNVRLQSRDPALLPQFEVELKGGSVLGKKFKANFTNGQLLGLSSVVKRRGDCSAPGRQGANITLGCWLSLDGLKSRFNVSSKGDSFFDSKKKYSVDLTLKNTNIFVEVTQHKPRVPTVKTLSVKDLTFNLTASKTLDLNDKRWKALESSVKDTVQTHVRNVLYGPFRNALQQSVRSLPLPQP